MWVEQDGFVKPVKLRAGASDETMTEIQGNDIKEGLEVVIGEQTQAAGSTGTVNPFTPQFRRPSQTGTGSRPEARDSVRLGLGNKLLI